MKLPKEYSPSSSESAMNFAEIKSNYPFRGRFGIKSPSFEPVLWDEALCFITEFVFSRLTVGRDPYGER